jgi:RNA polymerase sigma-70 factor (ECF subfamily)
LTKTSATALTPRVIDAVHRLRDRALVMRVADGDVAALRTLYEKHAPHAMAIAFRILGHTEEAEDVVQETFVDLWRRSAQFDADRAGAGAWIATIARSRAIDRLRTSRAAGRALGAATASDQLVPTAFPSPFDQAEGRRDATRVATALAALPPEQRETIELAYFEGLSQSEIVLKTGVPLGTVKMRVRLAINKLAASLNNEEA